MTIKVAYDISMIAKYYSRSNFQTFGIFRVIEEILRHMIGLDDIELTTTRLCEDLLGPDYAYNSLSYFFYLNDRKDWLTCKFANPFESRLGFADLYRMIYTAYYSEVFESTRLPLHYFPIKLLRKILSYAQKVDVCPSSNMRGFDIFHSTYCKLPPEDSAHKILRILTIYDLIPIVTPHYVTPKVTALFQDILSSINIEKDWVICISEYTKHELCHHMNMSPDRVFVVPLAAAQHFHPVKDSAHISQVRQQYGIPEGDYFLSLATLQPRKNLAHLIHAFDQLLLFQPNLDLHLILVGAIGWMHEDILAASTHSEQLRSKVIFTGYVPDQDLSAIYSKAKAFVYPSLYEGFGLPPLEAMQCGVPVIASNTTSLPEVIGDAGIMVDPLDLDALCQAMLKLATDSTLCQELGQKGLARSQHFSWIKSAENTAEIYRKIAHTKG